MPKYKTLEEFEATLNEAVVDPRTLFGTGPEIDVTEQRFHIFCHPDRHPPEQKDLATKLFAQVTNLAEQARGPVMTVKSTKREYTFEQRAAVGDVADVYLAAGKDISKPVAVVTKNRVMPRSGVSEPDTTYLIKVSRIPGGEANLDREQKVLLAIEQAAVAKTVDMSAYYPTLVESFPATQRFKRRVNVFGNQPGLYTLEQVANKHPYLDARHTVWIFKRMLTALAFAHQQGIVWRALFVQQLSQHGRTCRGWDKGYERPVGGLVCSVRFGDSTRSAQVGTQAPPRAVLLIT